MTNWRQILSWRVSQELTVGSRVRVIANTELLNSIGVGPEIHTDEEAVETGDILRVTSIISGRGYFDGPLDIGYHGQVNAGKVDSSGDILINFCYPYSHWKDFFEVID